MPIPSTLAEILLSLLPAFTSPSAMIFRELLVAWFVCPGRRTITGMLPFADPEGRRHFSVYHRFIRVGAWSRGELFRLWASFLVHALAPEGVLWLQTDDTVHKKSGRKVEGASTWRDAVRSTKSTIVYAWGLQFVPLCLRVNPPWGGEPLALPIHVRLHRKGETTCPALVEEMVRDVEAWLPKRKFHLVADGAYACLCGACFERTHVTSRLRRDATLYDRSPKRKKGQRGRPRKKGARLPKPEAMAKRARRWRSVMTVERSRERERLVHGRVVLWYGVAKDQPLLLVISRDPAGKEKDDFFVTTDEALAPARVVEEYAARWAVEDTFRNVKQFLGAEEPQSWKGAGPERAGALAYLVYGVVWLWYIRHGHGSAADTLPERPWYAKKSKPSFQDALAALRTALWRERLSGLRIFDRSASQDQTPLIHETLIAALARAA
jgi:hypothetical protein